MTSPAPVQSTTKPRRIALGHVQIDPIITPICQRARIAECLEEHAHRRWGLVEAVIAYENERAVAEGRPIVSVHLIDPSSPDTADNRLCIVTSHDRGSTRVLSFVRRDVDACPRD